MNYERMEKHNSWNVVFFRSASAGPIPRPHDPLSGSADLLTT